MSKGKKHKPTDATRATVKALSGYGITQAEIANYIKCTPPTLRKHYREELDLGGTQANMQVIGALFKNAVTNQNVSAQIFWAKTRCGWVEPQVHQLVGRDGGPIEVAEVSPLERIESRITSIAERKRASGSLAGTDGS